MSTSKSTPTHQAGTFGSVARRHEPARGERHPAFATSLANGLEVLQCFRTPEPALTNKDLVSLTGLSKGTISRVTSTLMEKGLLIHDSRTRQYRLGVGMLNIAYPLLAGMRIRQVSRPFMRELANRCGATVSMGVYDRGQMVYVETARSHDLHAFRPEIGAQLPFAATAMGRAWYAQASAEERDGAVFAMKQANPTDWKTACEALQLACHNFQEKGYCESLGDWHPDVHAVAAPMNELIDNELFVFNCGVRVSALAGESVGRLAGAPLLEMIEKVRTAVHLEHQKPRTDPDLLDRSEATP